jgi:hypothetical protein
MEFPLTLTPLGPDQPALAVMAQAELGTQAAYGSPELIFGRLLEASAPEILAFKAAPGVTARFRGAEYDFEELETTGRFKLVRRAR